MKAHEKTVVERSLTGTAAGFGITGGLATGFFFGMPGGLAALGGVRRATLLDPAGGGVAGGAAAGCGVAAAAT